MKLKIALWLVLLIITTLSYVYLKDYLMTVAALNWRSIDIITTILIAIIVTYTISKIVDLTFTKAFTRIIRNDSLWKKLLPLIHNIILISIWILWFLTTVNILWFNITTLLTWAWIGWILLALSGKEAVSP